ncbi:hypothetical protein GCM10010331_73930 [Streptomyces xanthochromogenes]|nr:hypothetical protein GCM10010331_73930 [Streptomyces xanthochromogenes]
MPEPVREAPRGGPQEASPRGRDEQDAVGCRRADESADLRGQPAKVQATPRVDGTPDCLRKDVQPTDVAEGEGRHLDGDARPRPQRAGFNGLSSPERCLRIRLAAQHDRRQNPVPVPDGRLGRSSEHSTSVPAPPRRPGGYRWFLPVRPFTEKRPGGARTDIRPTVRDTAPGEARRGSRRTRLYGHLRHLADRVGGWDAATG